MFANKTALVTLVECDANATDDEKRRVIGILNGERLKDDTPKGCEIKPKVVRYSDAAKMLGVTNGCVVRMVKRGTLKGVYCGGRKMRATGVVLDSIEKFVENSQEIAEAV